MSRHLSDFSPATQAEAQAAFESRIAQADWEQLTITSEAEAVGYCELVGATQEQLDSAQARCDADSRIAADGALARPWGRQTAVGQCAWLLFNQLTVEERAGLAAYWERESFIINYGMTCSAWISGPGASWLARSGTNVPHLTKQTGKNIRHWYDLWDAEGRP